MYAEDGILKEKPGALLPEDGAVRFRAGKGGGNLTEICTQSNTILQDSDDALRRLNLSILWTFSTVFIKI